jgi:hypothetical protein
MPSAEPDGAQCTSASGRGWRLRCRAALDRWRVNAVGDRRRIGKRGLPPSDVRTRVPLSRAETGWRVSLSPTLDVTGHRVGCARSSSSLWRLPTSATSRNPMSSSRASGCPAPVVSNRTVASPDGPGRRWASRLLKNPDGSRFERHGAELQGAGRRQRCGAIVEPTQHSRWPHAAETKRARGFAARDDVGPPHRCPRIAVVGRALSQAADPRARLHQDSSAACQRARGLRGNDRDVRDPDSRLSACAPTSARPWTGSRRWGSGTDRGPRA